MNAADLLAELKFDDLGPQKGRPGHRLWMRRREMDLPMPDLAISVPENAVSADWVLSAIFEAGMTFHQRETQAAWKKLQNTLTASLPDLLGEASAEPQREHHEP